MFAYHTTLNIVLRQDFVCKKHAGTPKGIYDFGFTIYEMGIFPEIAFCFSDVISAKTPDLHTRRGRHGRHSLALLRKSHIHVGIISQSTSNLELAS